MSKPIRKRNRSGFHPVTGKNRRGFTREECSRGGSRTKGYQTEEEMRLRNLEDARGMVLSEGCDYTAKRPEGIPWCKRRAVYGRLNQVEVVYGGRIIETAGETTLSDRCYFVKA